MFTKTAFGLAIILATASGALAATHNIDPSHAEYTNVYNPLGAYVGTDPDLNVRLGVKRDWGAGGD
jgi:hypothetical protein